MTFFVSLESVLASDAETEAEAIEEIKTALIERLEKGDVEWFIEEEQA